jgi:acid phosphatase (class A)
MLRKLFLVPALWLIAATPALSLSNEPYLKADMQEIIRLLGPPPAPGSAEQQRDIDAVLNAQKARTPQSTKRAEEDAKVDLFAFADVLGPKFAADSLPTTVAFFRKVNAERGRVVNVLKDCWERPRPFVANADVHPPGTMEKDNATVPGTKNVAPHDAASSCRPLEPVPAYSYSYPSGHSTYGALTAILLANMVPEKRSELFARGWEYGRNRVVGGVHYPTDVEAGRIEATVLVSLMMQNPAFNSDFASSKAELRRALGLNSLN